MHRLAVGQLIKLCARHCQINDCQAVLGWKSWGPSSSTNTRRLSPVSEYSLLQQSMVNCFQMVPSHSEQILNRPVGREKALNLSHGFELSQWGIHWTQVTPTSCGWAHGASASQSATIDRYGVGSTATACCTRRQKSFPRLRELRRLKRNTNSSR